MDGAVVAVSNVDFVATLAFEQVVTVMTEVQVVFGELTASGVVFGFRDNLDRSLFEILWYFIHISVSFIFRSPYVSVQSFGFEIFFTVRTFFHPILFC